jgi:hypothetical protein
VTPPPALARCRSRAEQNEVEDYFNSTNALGLPYLVEYWIGARTYAPPYYWNWTDYAVPGINVTYYANWGTVQADGEHGPTISRGLCAAALQQKAYGSPSAWGWEAAACTATYFPMCKIMRRWQGAKGLLPPDCAAHAPLASVPPARRRLPAAKMCWVRCMCTADRPPGVPAAPGLQPDALYTSTSASRYIFVSNPMNQTDAQGYCQSLGGHLTSFKDADEQASWVVSVLQDVRCRLLQLAG